MSAVLVVEGNRLLPPDTALNKASPDVDTTAPVTYSMPPRTSGHQRQSAPRCWGVVTCLTELVLTEE